MHKYNIHLLYYEGAKAIQWERKVCLPNGAETIGYPQERNEGCLLPHIYTKIIST